MKRALVTGGAGFLGSHLSRRLVKEGYEVVALDNLYTGARANIADLEGGAAFRFVEGDVTEADAAGLARLGLGGVRFDEIYNLACPASPIHYQARPLFTTKTSFLGVLNMLELAKVCGARMLQASTSEIYGDPVVHPQVESYWGNVNTIGIRSCYDEGKRVAETLCADFCRGEGVDVRMVRIFNTYGPYMHPQDGRVISNFIMQALRNEDITIYGDGSQTRSFQYCDDLIEAFRRYMSLDRKTLLDFFRPPRPPVPVINTGNPGEYTIRELAEKVLAFLPESKSKIVCRPLPSDDPKKRKPDITLAHELLGGWTPSVPLDEGLRKTMEYFRGRFANPS